MNRYIAAGLASLALLYSSCSKQPESTPVSPPVQNSAPVKPSVVEKKADVPSGSVSLSFSYEGLDRLRSVTVDLGDLALADLKRHAPVYCAVTGSQESRLLVENDVSNFTYVLSPALHPSGRDFIIYAKIDSSRMLILHSKSLDNLLPKPRGRYGK